MKIAVVTACGACLLTGVSAWAADTVSEGGSFHDAATWGGTMPATGTQLYIRGPGEVVFSGGSRSG